MSTTCNTVAAKEAPINQRTIQTAHRCVDFLMMMMIIIIIIKKTVIKELNSSITFGLYADYFLIILFLLSAAYHIVSTIFIMLR